MRKAITLRLDPALLAEVRSCAQIENRSMTNFIETAVKYRIAAIKSADTDPHVRPVPLTERARLPVADVLNRMPLAPESSNE